MTNVWFRDDADTVLVNVKAMPGSQHSEIEGLRGDEIIVRIAAQPEKGKANEELVRLFAKTLGCSKSEVELVRGETTRRKIVRLSFDAFATLKKLVSEK
jgi:uncharacterized protein